MTRSAIKVDGLRELKKQLKSAGDDLHDLRDTNAAAAAIVSAAGKTYAPRVSGALAGTVRSSGTKAGGAVRAGFGAVPYAGPIHFGWAARNIAPQPFLYEAIDARYEEVIDAYRIGVDKIIEKNNLK